MAKVNIVMDMSQYDMFLLCPERFRLRYKLNLSSPKKSAALDRGTLIHVACEVYYDSLKSGAKYEYAVNSALMKMKAAFAIESDLSNDEANHLVDTMEQYFDHWRIADQSFEILGVEEPFIFKLYEDEQVRIHLAGKIDLRISDNKYKSKPLDHKSFSRSGPVNEMSNQFKNYCVVTESNFLDVNRIGLQKSLKPHEKFLRVPLTYDPLIFESWKRNVVANIMYYLQCEADGYFPTNETSCDKFNRVCEYYNVCKSSGETAKLFKMQNEFIQIEPWDVSKALAKSSESIKDENNDSKDQIADRS
jgi:hypothetical protein